MLSYSCGRQELGSPYPLRCSGRRPHDSRFFFRFPRRVPRHVSSNIHVRRSGSVCDDSLDKMGEAVVHEAVTLELRTAAAS